jgi:hypothetical protein
MRKIRHGVFETNSSSTHSITVPKDAAINDSLRVSEDGVCEIETGEFGWEYARYTDAATKASYCATFAKNTNERSYEYRLISVIKNKTGAKSVKINQCSNEEYNQWGYIDHQSIENECPQSAFESDECLERFIFSRDSELVTDNDNH